VIHIVDRFKEWLFQSSDRRRAERYDQPCTVAYYWDGSVPVPHELRDISLTGAYLRTPERWYLGTIVKLTLKTDQPGAKTESVEVRCRVVRHAADGVGLQFISQQVSERTRLQRFLMSAIANLRRNSETDSEDSTKGQALIEFAFMMPVIFLLLIVAINYGGLFYAWITCANAARAGAQYAAFGGASVGTPSRPSTGAVQTLLSGTGSDTSSLPNSVTICVTTNSGNTSVASSCSGFPAVDPDPEAASHSYTLKAVDVQYTYSPFFGSFSLPGLGISLPSWMPTTVRMRTRMRVLN
jgi:Flp pilus assembly protein TadG